MTTREVTLASLSKVVRNAGANFRSVVAFVVTLGNQDDTKDTLIDGYAAGMLDLKASEVACIRLRASPSVKAPNAYGQRTDAEHKAIRAAEVFWVRVRNAAGFKPAKSDGRAGNAKKALSAASLAKLRVAESSVPVTLQHLSLPTTSDATEALAWMLQLSIKAKTFRNQNAKLFNTLGDSGMAIRDALAALSKAIEGAKAATKKARAQPTVVTEPDAIAA